jgi:transcriptional regulator with XRE-family HTH domain
MGTITKSKHIGRNISRIRELRGMKQEALAIAIGVSQQYVSSLEGSETIDEEKLKVIADALDVSVEAIKNFSDEAVLNIIGNTYHDSNVINGSVNGNGYSCTFNPLDKLIESYDESKKLYERLVQAEKEKIEYLEKLLKGK